MLGVLLFELLAGKAPFEAESTQQVYELVKRGIEHVRFPFFASHLWLQILL
jgi:serine/threonine protein kinase